jgi:integrase
VVPHHTPAHAGAKTVPTVRLTDLSLLNFKPSQKLIDFWDTSLPTFGVRVSPKGTKTFMLKLHGGRQAIGRYPIISLQEARSEAKRLLAERTLGKLRPQSITYPQAANLFVEDKARSRRPKTAESYEWMLNRFTFKGQLSEIRGDDIARTLKGIKSRSTYDHALVAARIFFNWAIKRRYIDHNPAFGLSPHGTPTRSRVLSDAELKAVWKAADQIGGHYGTIVKLLLCSGQRRGEIAALHTSWIQNDHIVLPKEITKNGRQHSFPIGTFCASLLPTMTQGLLFPARGTTNKSFNGWSKSKAVLDILSGVTKWTLHDLRRTFATNAAQLGVAPHVVEKLLNHATGTISGVAGIYNRFQYEKECREAIELWENKLHSIVGR